MPPTQKLKNNKNTFQNHFMITNYIFLGSAGRAEPFKSAAPLRGAGRSRCIVRLLPVPVRLQKPPVATALPADPSPNLRAFASWLPQAANFVDFKQFFRRLKTHQKSTTSQNLPKPQKLRP